jgi:N4-(beta-N-acetylglucosaminyl)-L-asparaginase
MRRGRAPKDAGMEALKRIRDNTVEKRLLTNRGLPNFGINFYVLNHRGEYAGVSMYEQEGNYRPSFAVCTESGAQIVRSEPLIAGNLRES